MVWYPLSQAFNVIYTSPLDRPVHSSTNSASPESIQSHHSYWTNTYHSHNSISISVYLKPGTHFVCELGCRRKNAKDHVSQC